MTFKNQVPSGITNALCFDIDDLAYSLDMKNGTSHLSEYLVEKETYTLLGLLDDLGLKATMFIPGYVAEHFPGLVGAIAAANHEVGSHGYRHIIAERLQRRDFRNDITMSKKKLEDITSKEVCTYRSPSWGITARTPWAYDELIDAGYRIDNTAQPGLLKYLGRSPTDMTPFIYKELLTVIPVTSFVFFGNAIPFNGGLFCAYIPIHLQIGYFKSLNRKGLPFNYFCHPYEANPEGVNRNIWKCHSLAATLYGMYFGRYRRYLAELSSRFRFGPLKEAYGSFAGPTENEHEPCLSSVSI